MKLWLFNLEWSSSFIFVIATLIIVLVCVIYSVNMNKRYEENRKKELALLTSINSKEIEDAIKPLIERKCEYRKNYFVFQLTDKVFGVASIVYSLLGFSNGLLHKTETLDYIIDFMALVCVIIAVFLSPRNRIREYDVAAKIVDSKIYEEFYVVFEKRDRGKTDKSIATRCRKMTQKTLKKTEKLLVSDES